MFHTLTIKDLRRETDDCASIAFEVPANLQQEFTFKAGQYLTLRATVNGQDLRRCYSICSSPLDGELRVAVKKIEGGKFSTFVNEQLRQGDTLQVMHPEGHFYTEPAPQQAKHYVAFAAGSGITPIFSLLKTILATEPQSRFTLLYGNREVQSILFREEIEGLKNEYMSRLAIHHFLSREQLESPMMNGRLSGEKCQQIFGKLVQLETVDAFFLCGPESMTLSIRDYLQSQHVPADHIHLELFTSPDGKLGQEKRKARAATADGKTSHVSIQLDGKTFAFDLPQGTDNILDAALKAGADLPFACKGGVCCTCKARVLEGKVEMDINYGLVAAEVEKGFVLTCQSYPTTETVSLNFDDL